MRLQTLAGRLLLVLFGAASIGHAGAAPPQPAVFDPGGGTVVQGVYINPYFGFRYPLPTGWKAGPLPPPPSYAGYYVLATPDPPPGAKATILVAAQDEFFADKSTASAQRFVEGLGFAQGLARRFSDRGGAAPASESVSIAGHAFIRLGIPAAPLSRIVLATEIRCHVLIFTLTSADAHELHRLAASLNRLSFAAKPAPPACIDGYATPKTIRRQVAPVAAGPRFVDVPVRIVIGADGKVQHIHVIRADPVQRGNIEAALAQWRFAPLVVDGRPEAVETGLRFPFGAKPAAAKPGGG